MTGPVDLSGPLYPGMWSYNVLPGMNARLPEFSVARAATIHEQGFEAFRLEMGTITGTYLENGGHMIEGVPPLHTVPLEDLLRPAVVCHLPRKGPTGLIHGHELAECSPAIHSGDALLIECGWGARWGEPGYVTESPAFHHDCLPWLLDQPISILGVDTPCIESARSRPDGSEETGSMLLPIFRKGILLLAPLVNLDRVAAPRGQLIALPLNVQGVSGAPCRAIWKEG